MKLLRKLIKYLKTEILYSRTTLWIKFWYRPYYFYAVGEMIFNEKYSHDHVAGRFEIYDIFSDSPYADDEIRYFTKNSKEFYDFIKKYEFKQMSERKLNKLIKEIDEKYNIFYEKPLVEN